MISAGVVRVDPRDRRDEPRVDGDEVGLLARSRASRSGRRARAPARPRACPSGASRAARAAGAAASPSSDPQAVLDVRAGAHVGEDRQLRTGRDVGARGRPGSRPRGSARAASPRRRGTGSTPGSGPRRVSVSASRATSRGGEVDRVGQDRPRPEPAGPVVDVEVVERLGEEPGDLAQLVRGPRTGASASRRRSGGPARPTRGASRRVHETAKRGVNAYWSRPSSRPCQRAHRSADWRRLTLEDRGRPAAARRRSADPSSPCR